MKTSLLIATYNWVEALQLVFKSIQNQTQLPDEILIADDGSTEETKQLISHLAEQMNIPVRHFWQEDKGFRKAKILNKAIAASHSDYIIQIDGDCILHKNFIKDHIANVSNGLYLYGARVNVLPQYVSDVLEEELIEFNIFSKEIKNKNRTLHMPFLARLYKPHTEISKKFRGCNVSFWRKDFIAVNGYNESFEGWGREDSELALRFHNYGLSAQRLKFAGIVYHIFHTEKSKHHLDVNNEMEINTLKNKIVWASNGIDKHLKTS